MPQITLYHNPRCSKSREALVLLQQHGVVPALQLYMDNPPVPADLRLLLAKLGLQARQLLRTSEPSYKALHLDNSALTEEQLLRAMCDDPRLIQRPIAVCGNHAVIGRPPEAILGLLS